MIGRGWWKSLALGTLLWSLTLARPSSAFFLDEDKDFRFTAQFYTQSRFRLQDSEGPKGPQTQLGFYSGGTPLNTQIGNLVQWRTYAAPVFEGSLLRALGLEGVLDDLSFRFAGRFSYDGIYDFGPDEFRESLRRYKVAAATPANDGSVGLGGNQPAPIFQGTKPVEQEGSPNKATVRAARLRDQELYDPRNELAQQAEAWEVYMNLQRGPLFVRLGRQNLSWGEADGVRLLDVINPIDNFFGLTFDEDLDEKRIPLWMLRSNLQLVRAWGPLASFGVESFFVPGVIDTTQSPTLFQGFLHPYAPPTGCDAQMIADNNIGALVTGDSSVPDGCRNAPDTLFRGLVKTSLYERLPNKIMKHSRFGARLVGILFGDYTMSVAAYRTWADAPAPRVHYLDAIALPQPVGLTIPLSPVIELTHGRETIIGGTLSFYQRRLLPGVVRAEFGYFFSEPGQVQLANQGDGPSGITDTFVPQADFVRWMIGYDVFELNVPWISHSNLVLITQWFNSVRVSSNAPYERLVDQANDTLLRNLPPLLPDRAPPPKVSENFGKFQLNPNPGRTGANPILPGVFDRYNATWSVALQAFMMHGKLLPQIVGVAFTEGDFGFLPSVTYRINDNLQAKVGYAGIYGKFSQLGLFRDRDQVGLRVTYQIN